MERVIKRTKGLKGEIEVSTDKSISHRAVIFSSLASGECIIKNFLSSEDTLSTCHCMTQLGIEIQKEGEMLRVKGKGLYGCKEPCDILNCGNSGTTMRLLSGFLAGQPFFSVLSGDQSLNRRPMKRVIEPLKIMGAEIYSRSGACAPLALMGRKLEGIQYRLPVASAQVKSCLLLAGLNAASETRLIEPEKTRDHSERMLASMGADIEVQDLSILIKPAEKLEAQEFQVPGDISSAAFFIVAALIVPGSEIIIRNVGINPTRSGIIDILEQMGARLTVENMKTIGGEPVADLVVSSSDLKAVQVEGAVIPRLIDELPILAVAMAMASGDSVVRDAGELRVKETDRIEAICYELGRLGVKIEETTDGFIVRGRAALTKGTRVSSHGDHRIAMSLAVAALVAEGETIIEGSEVVNISYPEFWETVKSLQQ